ncbi:STAS domain-containing protein [Couchioplanes caeruleus]|uniref:STAS domain-containing protein n=1 Tax=Couchioplanes caeruleus TaxID=56438 RepID=UPI0020BFF3D3|nr:STAS domain-containing protein [Couchioplanes caeruleus]UQU67902.1 STAS domain-containing protein [Couchioplanes caeruleus]
MTPREPRRLAVDGELTVLTAAAQKERLIGALQTSSGLRVDLSGVDEVDTAGLQVLLLARREADRLNVPFELGPVRGGVAAVLAMAGLDAAEEE